MQRRIAMKKVIVSMLAVGAFIFLTGCEEKPKTRDYYKQHVEEAFQFPTGWNSTARILPFF